jgi:hypothetical protein
MVRKYRRNFLPAFIITVLLWLAVAFIVFKTSPDLGNIFLFFLSLTPALALTLALLLGNTRRGFLLSLCVICFLILRLVF